MKRIVRKYKGTPFPPLPICSCCGCDVLAGLNHTTGNKRRTNLRRFRAWKETRRRWRIANSPICVKIDYDISLIDYDISLSDIESMPDGKGKAIQYAVYGLMTDGGHHKQWFLERVIKSLGINLKKLRKALLRGDYDWEDGIAPQKESK